MQKDNRGSLYKDYDEMEKVPKEKVEKLKGPKDWYKCYLSGQSAIKTQNGGCKE